jgi:hypothetical protein
VTAPDARPPDDPGQPGADGNQTGARKGPTGLARFVRPARARPQPPDAMRQFMERRRSDQRAGELCEMCGEAIPPVHSHLVHLEHRTLVCTCRPCYLVFLPKGAGAGKYRCVPERYLYDAEFRLTDAQWDELQIPVSMAFFFFNSDLGRSVAFYPSPAGATESLLPLESWDELRATNPLFSSVEADVEALLVFRRPGGFECYLVPIDACYELVGRVRMRWKGFDGGEELWDDLETFFAGLRERSRPALRAAGHGTATR